MVYESLGSHAAGAGVLYINVRWFLHFFMYFCYMTTANLKSFATH